MKATKLLLLLPVLFTGLAALSLAGPSPQFWDQQARNQQEQKAKADPKPAKVVKVCSNCGCADTKK